MQARNVPLARKALPARVRRGTPLALVAAAVLVVSAPAQAVVTGGKSIDHKPAGAGSGKRIR